MNSRKFCLNTVGDFVKSVIVEFSPVEFLLVCDAVRKLSDDPDEDYRDVIRAKNLLEEMSDIDSVQPESITVPLKIGHWIRPMRKNAYYRRCSVCGGKCWNMLHGTEYEYCPRCSARMSGEVEISVE